MDKPNLTDRVKNSGCYYRIRDAEIEMNRKLMVDADVKKRREQRKKIQKANLLGGSKTLVSSQNITPSPPSALFVPFVMNDDKKLSKYFDYDDLYFPKIIHMINLGPRSLDSMYMAGFIDRQNRDSEQIANMQMKKELDINSEANKKALQKVRARRRKAEMEKVVDDPSEYLSLIDSIK